MGNLKEFSKSTPPSLLKCEAAHRLHALARFPFDLSAEGNLTAERVHAFTAQSTGYLFLYGTERVTQEVMRLLLTLAKEMHVFEKMQRMRNGEICNYIQGHPSENRAVLHTATRDQFEPWERPSAASEASQVAKQELDKLREFIKKNESDHRFDTFINIGIGGSDLGPKAHYIALESQLKKGRTIRFISNLDPDDALSALKDIKLEKTVVAVVSKSGATLETEANEAFVRSFFIKAGLNPKEHFIAITGKGSSLDDPKRFFEIFYIWDWIGGRYSTTSMVGGVLLSFAFGFECFWEFLKGAHAMDQTVLNESLQENLPLLGAVLSIWNRTFLGYPTLALIPYSKALARYSAHIQQLEMESNGKHIDQMGHRVSFPTAPIIWGEPGTNAQHSFFQLIHQGTDPVPIEFIGYKESQQQIDLNLDGTTLQQKLLANLFAQAIAFAQGERTDNPNKECTGNRPSHILLGKKLTPYSLGALLSYFENKTAFEGFLWGINSFDQEGVQLGKKLAGRVIDCFNEKGHFPLAAAYLDMLN